MKNLLWLMCVGLFATVLVSPVRAEEENRGQAAGTIIVPDGLKLEEVQRSILEGAVGRGWTVRKKEKESVNVVLEQGNWLANVTFTFDTKEIQIFSKSLKSGKPKLPEDWIKNLKKDITKSLNTKAYLK